MGILEFEKSIRYLSRLAIPAVLCASVALAAPASAQRSEPAGRQQSESRRAFPITLPEDLKLKINTYFNIVYGDSDQQYQIMDAYIVKSDEPTPVLAEFHGGGFTRGSKSGGAGPNWMNFFVSDGVYMQALRAGISVVSVEYRRIDKYPLSALCDDAARSIQFIRYKAKEWNIDPTRIAACGSSAGGHLSAFTAYRDDQADPNNKDPVKRRSSRLNAVVVIDGPIDFTHSDARVLQIVKLSGKEGLRRASPLTYASPDDPPTMIAYSARDGEPQGDVPDMIEGPHNPWYGVLLAQTLDALNVPYSKYFGPGKGTGIMADPIMAFLKKYLKPRGSDTPEDSPR